MRLIGLALVVLHMLVGTASAQTVPAPDDILYDSTSLDGPRMEYGQWLGLLEAQDNAVNDAFDAMFRETNAIEDGDRSPGRLARGRVSIENARVAIDRANAALAALNTPAFPLLDLPEELSAIVLRDKAIQAHVGRIGLLDALKMLIDRNDAAVANAIYRETDAAAVAHLSYMATMSEARAMTYPRGQGYHCYYRLLSVLYRSNMALVGVTKDRRIDSGPQFQAKIEALVRETDDILALCEAYATNERAAIGSLRISSGQVANLEAVERQNEVGLAVLVKGQEIRLHLQSLLVASRRGEPLVLAELSDAIKTNKEFEAALFALVADGS